MNFITRLFSASSIRARLLAACCGLWLLTALVGETGISRLTTMNAALQQAVNESLPAVSHLAQADREMQRALVAERTVMVMKSNSPAAQQQMKSFTNSVEQITEHWKAYVVSPAHVDEAKLRSDFEAAEADWERSAREVLKLLGQGSMDARKDAIAISLNEGAAKFEKARKILRSLSDMHLSVAAASAKAGAARAAAIRWWMFVGIGIALVSAFAVSLGLGRSIVRPLAETVAVMRAPELTPAQDRPARPADGLGDRVADEPAAAAGGLRRPERRRMRAEDPTPVEFIETLTVKGANGHTHTNGYSHGNGQTQDGVED